MIAWIPVGSAPAFDAHSFGRRREDGTETWGVEGEDPETPTSRAPRVHRVFLAKSGGKTGSVRKSASPIGSEPRHHRNELGTAYIVWPAALKD